MLARIVANNGNNEIVRYIIGRRFNKNDKNVHPISIHALTRIRQVLTLTYSKMKLKHPIQFL